MENKHTPGPWWPYQNTSGVWGVATRRDHDPEDLVPHEFGASICYGIGDHTEKRTSGNEEANARLIAAAPDLLEKLERISNEFRQNGGVVGVPALLEARAAIAKARGE